MITTRNARSKFTKKWPKIRIVSDGVVSDMMATESFLMALMTKLFVAVQALSVLLWNSRVVLSVPQLLE